MLTNEQINEILAMCEKATPIKWHRVDNECYAELYPVIPFDVDTPLALVARRGDADYIVAACNAFPQLAAEYRKAMEVVEAIKVLMEEMNDRTYTHSLDMGGNHGITIRVSQGEKGKSFWDAVRRYGEALAGLEG